MGKFVSKERVPIVEETPRGPNIVYIRAKMDNGTKNKVIGAGAKVSLTGEVDVDVGAYQTALLEHNVLGWEGPDFLDESGKPIPCTPENIRSVDSDDPQWQEVLEEIARRNPQGADSKKSEAAGSNGSKEAGKKQRADSTQR